MYGIASPAVTLGLQGCVLARCAADNTVMLLSDDKVPSLATLPHTLTPCSRSTSAPSLRTCRRSSSCSAHRHRCAGTQRPHDITPPPHTHTSAIEKGA